MSSLGAMLLLVGACTKPAPTSAVPPGWIDTIVLQPSLFSDLVHDDPAAGWIALHGGALPAAAQPLPTGEARRLLARELAAVHADLGRLSRAVWVETFALWSKKSGIPAGSAMPVIAALAALDGGDAAAAKAWLDRGASYGDPQVATVAAELRGGLAAVTEATPLGACVHAHLRTRETGDLAALAAACPGLLTGTKPMLQEGDRALYDPLLHETLARALRLDPAVAPASDPSAALRELLFTDAWSATDRQVPPAWAPPLPSLADPDMVNPWDEQLDALLDPWEQSLRNRAEDEGEALLDDLDLRAVYRSQLMLGLARAALDQSYARTASALALNAADLTRFNQFTPRNRPGLYAVSAAASYRLGDARAALDSLTVLRERWPEMAGLVETMGDLAILQTLDRQGDSKEN